MKKIKYYKGDMIDYEIYDLVDFYDPILRQPTVPVKLETLDDFERARYLAFSLAETLGELQGLGLSANQVGLRDRVCTINMGNEIWTMFNPEIVDRSLAPSKFEEGCLSYQGLYLKVDRSEWVKVKFQAVGGQFIEETFSGLTAVCVQHEIDHLDGIMFTDKVSPIKLDIAKRKVKKNVKRIKAAASKLEVAQEQEQLQTNQLVVSEKQKMKPIAAKESPRIQILETPNISIPPAGLSEKQPDKFVYKVVSS
jgi:peptide deformylase